MSIQRILVVDDSDTDRLTLIRLLNKNGFETIEAINGRDGVNKAKELLPDLILMDVVMPELSGFEATRLITQDPTTKNIPVIICSSKGLKTGTSGVKKSTVSISFTSNLKKSGYLFPSLNL